MALLSTRLQALIVIVAMLTLSGCSPGDPSKDRKGESEIIVAAAANLTDAFEEIGRQFTAETGVRVTYSFGATADLARQIENGGPFDVYAAADVAHVDELVRKGFVMADTRAVYARGRLVLWTPPGSSVGISRVEELKRADVKLIAIAKPEVAPYGRAAVESLNALGLWPEVEPRVVYAQNVAQAKQFAASGNADVAFLPRALMKQGEWRYIEIDERLHQPIDQAMGVVTASVSQDRARRFVEFVLSAEGQATLERFGYVRPPAP
ncbi:MAG TPA: molybdate ABC transporter substrate-binding protein [Blastocatellia bacterium]|nr:molybdate ABC transporter substrate-binding protein [Blastocatellia bacterium]